MLYNHNGRLRKTTGDINNTTEGLQEHYGRLREIVWDYGRLRDRDAEVRFGSVRGRFFPNREPNFGSVRPVTANAERPVRFGSNARTNRNLPSSLSGRKIVKISNICGPKWKNTDYFCLGLCARVLRCLPTKWHSLQSLGIDGCKPLNLDEVQVISIMYD